MKVYWTINKFRLQSVGFFHGSRAARRIRSRNFRFEIATSDCVCVRVFILTLALCTPTTCIFFSFRFVLQTYNRLSVCVIQLHCINVFEKKSIFSLYEWEWNENNWINLRIVPISNALYMHTNYVFIIKCHSYWILLDMLVKFDEQMFLLLLFFLAFSVDLMKKLIYDERKRDSCQRSEAVFLYSGVKIVWVNKRQIPRQESSDTSTNKTTTTTYKQRRRKKKKLQCICVDLYCKWFQRNKVLLCFFASTTTYRTYTFSVFIGFRFAHIIWI